MGCRSTIILIAALLTVIGALFSGDSASLIQGLGVILLFGLIIVVGRVFK